MTEYPGQFSQNKLKRNIMLLMSLWTLLIAGFFIWDVRKTKENIHNLAKKEARIHFQKDRAFRLWGSSHGGVYVPISDKAKPNKYLNVPERDITTKSGKKLTLINPAYMVRQMMDYYRDLYGVKGELTSLKYINPINAPDKWQYKALKSFESGAKEAFEFTTKDEKPYLRLMQPLRVKKTCLKCHGFQGYKVGHIRGGIGVSVPMKDYLTSENHHLVTMSLTHGIIWIFGIFGLSLGYFKGRQNYEKRILAEKEVFKSWKRYKSVLDTATDTIITINEEGKIIFANTSVSTLLGYKPSELDNHSIKLIIPDFIESFLLKRLQHKHLQDQEDTPWKPVETIARHKNGQNIDIECSAGEYNEENHLLFTIILRDISERKLSEIKVRESEERLKAIMDNSPTVIYLKDTEGKYILINKRFEKLFHITQKEMVGKTDYDIFPKELADAFRINDEKVLKVNKPLELEEIASHDDGNHIYISNKFILYDETGKAYGVCGISTDITNRKKSEEKLKLSEQRLTLHVERTPLGVIEWDKDFRVLAWNKSAESIFGYSKEEAMGRHPSEFILDRSTKEIVDQVWEQLVRLSGGDSSINTNLTKDGRSIICHWYNTSLIDKDNNFYGVASLVQDITKRKQDEKELQLYREQLEDMVRSRTDELTESYRELEKSNEELEASNEELANTTAELEEITAELIQANNLLKESVEKEKELARLKEEFTSNVNHELKTPLTSILMIVDYLLESLPELSQDELESEVKRISKAGTILLGLITELLDLSRLDADRYSCHLSTFKLSPLIEKIRDSYEVLCKNKNINLIVDYPEDISITNDFDHVYKIINNLMSNAHKFIQEGEIRLEARKMEEFVQIVVSDTGIGIDKEDFERIFDRYSQGVYQNSKAPGTGIGLHMVKKLTEKHGGKVTLNSETGKGSVFTIILPYQSKWND